MTEERDTDIIIAEDHKPELANDWSGSLAPVGSNDYAAQLTGEIAAGADDRVGSLTSFSRRAAELIEGATLSLHPELGHFGPLESPERVGAEILDWLGAVTG